MQINQSVNTCRSFSGRLISCFLALIMLQTFIPQFKAFADYDNNGFQISLSWNKNGDDPYNFDYESDSDESKIVRLKVVYENKEVSHEYEPGAITITVPGIKGAVRNGNSYIPSGIAADSETDPEKNYNWSYSYTEATDTYTFTNNMEIPPKSTFEGSFEIIWVLPSRETVHGYEASFQAELFTETAYASSNIINYRQTRERDRYWLDKEKASPVYRDEMPSNNYDDYIWVEYSLSGSDTYLARDVEGPERFDCYFLDDAEVYSNVLQDSGRTEEIDGKTYKIWSAEKDITNVSDSSYISKVFVAYPKSKYKDEYVMTYTKLCGTYYEENDESILAETDCGVNLGEFGFTDIPGDIYNVEKESFGIHGMSIDEHCEDCMKKGAVNSLHLLNGKGEYYSDLKLELNYRGKDSARYEADYYDLEFTDDFLDVQMKDGSIRQLDDEEYNFTSVYIPSNNEILNANGFPIKSDTYKVEIYRRIKAQGSFEETPFTVTEIKDYSQNIELTDDTVGIKVIIRGMQESIFKIVDTEKKPITLVRCYYAFHTEDSSILTDGGKLFNNMFFRLYGHKGDSVFCNDGFDRKNYDSEREYNRDIEIYGSALDRENDIIHILEIPNEFKLSDTSIDDNGFYNDAFHFNGSITSDFLLGEGTELKKFSMYTIIPKGLKLNQENNSPESLLEAVTFSSSDGLSSAYIASHTTIEIIADSEKYDGREYVAFHYDFSDSPVSSSSITVSGIPMYISKYDLSTGVKSYTMYASMMVEQEGKWNSNGIDSNLMENGIWKDINNNNNTSEKASFNSGSITFSYSESTHVSLTKFVETPMSNGLRNPSPKDGIEAVPKTYIGGDYSYYLRADVENTNIKNIIFADAIENPANGSEWFGSFVDVDCSQITDQLSYDGEPQKPVIYYSTEYENFGEIKREVFTDPDSNWTTSRPENAKIKSIAVDFGNGVASPGSQLMLEIKMKAAEDISKCNTMAINSGYIGYYKKNDETGEFRDYNSLESNLVPVRYVSKGRITLTKKDESNKNVINGAEFELYKKGQPDVLIDTYTVSSNGSFTAKDLLYGEYYFKETKAPKGYKLSDKQSEIISISEENLAVKIDFENERKEGTVTIKKVSDRNPNLEIENAEFSLYRSDDTLIKSGLLTNSDGNLTVNGLEWGSYYFQETKAPDGYAFSDEKICFEINEQNDAGRELGEDGIITVVNKQLPASAVLVKSELGANKYDMPDSNMTFDRAKPIKGAVYELYDENDRKLTSRITDKDGKIYAENLDFGRYYFMETVPAIGYEKYSEKIWFEVGPEQTHKELEILTADARKKGSIWIQKLNDEGKIVTGAVYGLFERETGKQLYVHKEKAEDTQDGVIYVYDNEKTADSIQDMVTDKEGIIQIKGMYWGDYYIKEIKSPRGYELNKTDEYDVKIDNTNASRIIEVLASDKRIKGSVKLTKVDEETEQKFLEGAVFTLYRSDGSVYRNDLRTGSDGTLTVKDLEWGSYYFQETKAPDGYGLNPQKVRFSVNYLTAEKLQEITVTDPAISYNLTVTKKIKTADIVFEHGNPSFIFEVKNIADNHTYYKTVSFSEEYIDSFYKDSEYAYASVVFPLPIGTYEISEVSTDRYETAEIEPSEYQDGNKARVTLNNDLPEITFTFSNDKSNQNGTSHNAMVANILNRSRKMTAIVAQYTGPETITTKKIDSSHLVVYAVYDDGTQNTVNYDETGKSGYTLEPKELDSSMNGNYTINVSYEEDGIRRTDSFDVNIDIPEMFTWKIIDENEFDENGMHFYGKVEINGYVGNSSVVAFPSVVTGWRELRTDLDDKYIDHDEYAGKKYKVVGINRDGDIWNSKTIYGFTKHEGIDKKTVKFAEGIEYIGDGSFRGSSTLECELEFPSTLKRIGSVSFFGCENITGGLYIPDSVEYIGHRAFTNCYKLNGELRLPDNGKLEAILANTFYQCGLTGDIVIPDGVTRIERGAFYECEGFNGKLILPDSVEYISYGEGDAGAFKYCRNISGGFRIPANLKYVGDEAFIGCGAMALADGENLEFPDTVEYIGSRAFALCGSMSGNLKLPNNEKYTTIKINTFYDCWQLKADASTLIPDNIKVIERGAFSNLKFINGQLKLPESLIKLGVANGNDKGDGGAFQKCTGITGQLILPDSLEEIGNNAFSECKGINGDLTIPMNLKSIGEFAFSFCEGFKGSSVLTIPKGNSLTKIGQYAFQSCYFDHSGFWNDPPSQSQVWIAINSSDTDKQETDKVSYVPYESDINSSSKVSTNATEVGDQICWGYQLPYGFFKRDN